MLIEKGLSTERYEEVIQKYKINFLITEYNNDYKGFTKELINIKENISEEKIFFYKRKNFSFIKYRAGTALILLTSGSTGEKKSSYVKSSKFNFKYKLNTQSSTN